jgi:TonB family protein
MNRMLIILAFVSTVSLTARAQIIAPSPQPSITPAVSQIAPQSPELSEAERLNAQVVRFYSEQKYNEALPLARRIVQIRERSLGSEHQLTVIAIHNLAAVLGGKGNHDEAERLYRRALPILERNLGGDAPAIADFLDSFALLMFAKEEYDEAEALYQRSLMIRERIFGTEHQNVEGSLLGLAHLYRARNQNERAEQIYRRILAINEGSHGANHPEVAGVLEQLRAVLQDRNQMDEAARLEARANAIRRVTSDAGATSETDSSRTLRNRQAENTLTNLPGALRARISQQVLVEITIDESGNVVEARPVRGPRYLRRQAVNVVHQWRFRPTVSSGRPVRAQGTIIVNFILD